MGFLRNLFKQKDGRPTKSQQSKNSQQTIPTEALGKAQIMASKNCWQAALWWTTKALELDPHSLVAKELFIQGVANTFLGLAKIIVNNKKASDTARLLKHGHMSRQDIEVVADHWISVYYAEQLQEEYSSFLDRFKKGKTQEGIISDSDLKSARELASSVGDELLPGQDTLTRWKSVVNPNADSFLASQISAQRETLIILLQAHSPSDWSNTCQKIYTLWKNDPVESARELALQFKNRGSDVLDDTEFRKYRDEFQLLHARNAAKLIHACNILREPNEPI